MNWRMQSEGRANMMQAIVTETGGLAWWVLAPIALLVGIAAGNSFTQGIKTWRKEHRERPLCDSDIRLIGRFSAFTLTFISWITLALLNSTEEHILPIAGGLASASFGLAPWCWEKGILLIRMVKPEWADRLSGQ